MSRWLFFPAPVVSTLPVATCSFSAGGVGDKIVRYGGSWVADTNGSGSTFMQLRNDAFGAFIQFSTSSAASTWLSAFSTYSVRITDSSSNVYEWSGGTMSTFASVYVKLALSNWSGSLPTGSSTVELFQ